jgi:hypothetical protein
MKEIYFRYFKNLRISVYLEKGIYFSNFLLMFEIILNFIFTIIISFDNI